jgi:hypothetical protein
MAFVALLATGAEKRMKYWRLALLESIGDLMPTAFAYLLFLCQLLLFPGTQSSWPLQLVMIVVFPFLVGWLFFNGLLLSSKFNGKTGVLLKQRIPHVWIAANMGFAGISLLGMPMVRQSIQYCPVFPPSVMTVIILWVIVGVGALAGAIFLFAFEYWSVLRGSRGWSAITTKEVSLVCGPWSKLWWWIIISYVILFAALATGIQ